jgi:hypothetical protein
MWLNMVNGLDIRSSRQRRFQMTPFKHEKEATIRYEGESAPSYHLRDSTLAVTSPSAGTVLSIEVE